MRQRLSGLHGDRGALAPAVPVLAFILLLLGGLVIDASRLLTARGRAVAYAEEAARAGASAIVPGQAELELDAREAEARVAAYCAAIRADADQNGGVQECRFVPPLEPVSGSDRRLLVVRVFVSLKIPASLLGIVGVDDLDASGQGTARPYEGVDPRDVDSSPPPVEVPVPDLPPDVPPDVDVPLPPPIPSVPPLPTELPSGAPSPVPSGSPLPEPSPEPSPQPSPEPSPTSSPPPP